MISMRLLTLDFETYYDQEYSLSKITTEEYIRDPRFEVIMVGLKMDDMPSLWVPAPQVPTVLARIPWDEIAVLCHHTHFDCAILSWRFGIRPKFICDTLSMFRALYPAERHSLENMCKVLGLKDKGHEVQNAKGEHFRDFDSYALGRYGAYCVGDVNRTYEAFQIMKQGFPISELQLIDLTTRLFTEPILELDPVMLEEAYQDERLATLALFQKALPSLAEEARKAVMENDEAAWKKLKTPLSSNPQFAEMLLALGVDPPKKLSPAAVKAGKADPETAGEAPQGLLQKMSKKELKEFEVAWGVPHPSAIWAYAFSKSDEVFKKMLGSENDDLRLLVEARFGIKSTIKETRAKRFMGIASRGSFPIYLKYYSAHTGRYGGGDKVNPQNLNKFCPRCQG